MLVYTSSRHEAKFSFVVMLLVDECAAVKVNKNSEVAGWKTETLS